MADSEHPAWCACVKCTRNRFYSDRQTQRKRILLGRIERNNAWTDCVASLGEMHPYCYSTTRCKPPVHAERQGTVQSGRRCRP